MMMMQKKRESCSRGSHFLTFPSRSSLLRQSPVQTVSSSGLSQEGPREEVPAERQTGKSQRDSHIEEKFFFLHLFSRTQ